MYNYFYFVMLTNISYNLRSLIAILSIGNLKEYLKKTVSILPPESSLKPIIVREILDNKNLRAPDLKTTLQKLKEIIKGYAQSNREPFQKTILEPIQAFNSPTPFDPVNMLRMNEKQKEILQKSEKELSQAQKQIQEDKTIPFPKVLT